MGNFIHILYVFLNNPMENKNLYGDLWKKV